MLYIIGMINGVAKKLKNQTKGEWPVPVLGADRYGVGIWGMDDDKRRDGATSVSTVGSVRRLQ